ncbi:hypothetical protein MKX01_029788 [Papaver californicum]|nr:hypothetical protein MKX01_029788 [Papaver californicum]
MLCIFRISVDDNQFPPLRAAPKKMNKKFTDFLAFNGPAPERINYRLAMIGFVAAMGVEVARGTDVAAQLADGGLLWFVLYSLFQFLKLNVSNKPNHGKNPNLVRGKHLV